MTNGILLMTRAPAALTVAFLLLLGTVGVSVHGQLQFGFYSDECPDAEDIVTAVVQNAAASDATILPALVRLQFHDCFVRGCDASVLITSVGSSAEVNNNKHQGLRGQDVVEAAKAALEDQCPGVVSCADIIALASRDAIAMTNGPSFQVPTGRRDGLSSNLRDADVLPDVSDSIQVLRNKFAASGLNDRDLVLLTAAHTIGTTACFFVKDRLYGYRGGAGSDPSIPAPFLSDRHRHQRQSRAQRSIRHPHERPHTSSNGARRRSLPPRGALRRRPEIHRPGRRARHPHSRHPRQEDQPRTRRRTDHHPRRRHRPCRSATPAPAAAPPTTATPAPAKAPAAAPPKKVAASPPAPAPKALLPPVEAPVASPPVALSPATLPTKPDAPAPAPAKKKKKSSKKKKSKAPAPAPVAEAPVKSKKAKAPAAADDADVPGPAGDGSVADDTAGAIQTMAGSIISACALALGLAALLA